MLHQPDIITISAKASTDSKLTHASFRASVTTYGESGPDAKAKATPVIEAIKRAIAEHAAKAGIDTERLKTTFAVDIHHNRNYGTFEGYQATYTVAFKAANIAEATRVHDALTSIKGVESPTPVFHLDKSPEVHERAFKAAANDVESRFKLEAQALGLEPTNYSIQSWEVSDEERRGGGGKFLALQSHGEGVDIEPGKATYDIVLSVAFRRR